MGFVSRGWNVYRKAGLRGVFEIISRRLWGAVRLVFDILFTIMRSKFFRPETGRTHKVGFFKKLCVLFRFVSNASRITGGSSWKEHILIATEILRAPPETEGVVVECGSFEGFSAANLSIVCELSGRKLYVCDSFEGLPKPRDEEGFTVISHKQQHYDFHEGQYKGSSETVRSNITRYGKIDVCHFVQGYFDQTLPELSEKIVVVFEDADLKSSVESCLRYLWGHLRDRGFFFCHEPWSPQIVELFYDRVWWRENMHSDPPGFYGSGHGIPLGISSGSGIGYAQKLNVERYLESSELRPGM